MREASARKPSINLRKLWGTRERSSNGNCINLSAQIHYYLNPSVKKPPFGATALSAMPTAVSGGSLPARGQLW